MKYLITGGLGHVGSALVKEYSQREDVDLIKIFDNINGERYNEIFENPENPKYEFIHGDITNLNDLEKAVSGIDVVIHLAGLTNIAKSWKNPEKTNKVNLEGTSNVLYASIQNNVQKFLFSSSTSIYNHNQGIVDENTIPQNPEKLSPYAETKLASEQLMKSVNSNGWIKTIILRKGTIFGYSNGMKFHTAVNKFCNQAVEGEELSIWENTLYKRSPFLGLNDTIRAYEFVEKNGEPGETYNVLTGNFTVDDVVKAIKKVIPDVKIPDNEQMRIENSLEVSNERIKKLGFKFKDNLESVVKKEIEFLQGRD